MATTNFALLTVEQKTAWSMNFWRHLRTREFAEKFTGTGDTAMIQKIPELTKTEKGTRAVMTLIQDSKGDGVAGDRQLEGNEEALRSSDIVIQIDQLRHAHRGEGRMAEQKSVVKFRKEAMNNLSFWLSDRRSQMAFLSLSGIAYDYHTDGRLRSGSQLSLLEFAADVTAPTAHRYFRSDWNGTSFDLLRNDANTNLAATDKIAWSLIVDLKAQAQFYKLKPIRTTDGIEFFHLFVHPLVMASLKKDPDYLANVRSAGKRGDENQLFKGTDTVMVDGIAITPYHHVFNTTGAASGSKWGGGTVEGSRCLFCGSQALGYADIGRPTWEEKMFDYGNQPGISAGKICGFRKPAYENDTTDTVEDFGVMAFDVAI